VTPNRAQLLLSLACLLMHGCTQPEPAISPTHASEEWFSCTGRFDCVVVYDAFCRKAAVNSDYVLVYQDWTRREVLRVGEATVCPNPEPINEAAGCRANRCVYPFGWEDFPQDPASR